MGRDTKIEWASHTFNPWIGCTKVSAGCANCYAEREMDHHWKKVKWGPAGNRVRTSALNWRQPVRWNEEARAAGKAANVFCASLADVYEDRSELVPWRRDLFDLIEATTWLNWMILTKRPEHVERLTPTRQGRSGLPGNVWLGTSVEDQAAADERVGVLGRVPARVHFLSMEPLLGPVKLAFPSVIDWVIVGGESGPDARPMHPDWVRSIRDQCRDAGIAFHFKQWGEWLPISEMSSEETDALYKSNRIAREYETQATLDELYGCTCRVATNVVRYDGKYGPIDEVRFEAIAGVLAMQTFRIGKKAAGRELDGRTWDEMPNVISLGAMEAKHAPV